MLRCLSTHLFLKERLHPGLLELAARSGAQAVDAPRFHHQYLPDKLSLEPGFPPETIAGLKTMGYDLDLRKGHWSNGECIAVDQKTGELLGGQDHRSHYGKAAGY